MHLPKVQATDRPQAVGPVDVVLFTVKLYDVDASAATLAPMIGPDTVVITLQNGVDAMDMVAKHVGADHVAGGAAYIVVVVDQPGHLRHTAGQSLVFGERDGRRSDRLVAFEEAGQRAGFGAKASSQVDSRSVDQVRATVGVERHDRGHAIADGCGARRSGALRDDDDGDRRGDRGRHRARHQVPARHCREHARDDSEFSRCLEVVDARRPRARPAARAAVAERRRGRIGKEVGVPTPIHQFITTVLTPFVNGQK